VLQLSMNIRCWTELARYGANSVLKREYGSLLKDQPEPDYNVTLEIDLDQVPPEGGMCLFSFFPLLDGSLRGTD
jgi:actin related protein 2/3 complex, subunit 2